MRHEILTRSCAAVHLAVLLAVVGCGTSSGVPAESRPAAAAVPVSTTGPELLARPLAGDPMAVTIHRLDNGLTVYISTDREQPKISAWIAVRAGGRHDPPNSTGLAHYLEHMLFKGTAKLGTTDALAEQAHLDKIRELYRKLNAEQAADRRQALLAEIDRETQAGARFVIPNELERIYTKLGASGMNAFTGQDATRYKIDVPSNRLAHWAAIESERLARPSFRLFFHELEAVYEEKNRALDSPERRGMEALMAMAWPAHPYGTQTTIGRAEHLRNPAFQDMIDYFQRWYVPNNMAIALAGDIDAETALPILREHFGRWSPRPLPAVDPGLLPPLAGRQFQEIRAETSEAVFMGWQVPGAAHADVPALAILDSLIGHGTAGLLQTRLVLPRHVTGAGTGLNTNREAGLWIIMGSALDGQSLPDLEQKLLQTVEQVKQGNFTDQDLAAIALDAEMGQKYELESPEARAVKMTEAFTLDLPWSTVVARELGRRRITRQDVIRVANTYLAGNFAVLYRRKGKFQPPKLTSPKVTPLDIPSGRESAFAGAIQAMPATPIEPVWAVEGRHYHKGRLPAGKLISARNVRNDLFHVRYQFDVGFKRDPLLCHAMDMQGLAGAGELSAEAFRRKLFVLGANIETWCGAEDSGVSVTGIDENLEQTLALADLWFRQPRFTAGELASQLKSTFTVRRRHLEDHRYGLGALAEFASRGPHSSYLTVPSNQTLASATVEDLRQLLMSYRDQKHETLYFGPRPREALAKVVAFGRQHRPVAKPAPRRYRPAGPPLVFVVDRDTAQATLDVAFTGPPLARRDRGAAMALSDYLSDGMGGGAVFRELRETTGLVYSASASYHWGGRTADDSALLADAQMQAPKAATATDRLLSLLRQAKVEPGRLAEVQAQFEQTMRTSRPRPRRLVSAVDSWDDYDYDKDPRPWLRKEIAALTPAQLAAFWRRSATRSLRVAITGDSKTLDRGWLDKLGKVEQLKPEALFGYGPFPAEAAPQARR